MLLALLEGGDHCAKQILTSLNVAPSRVRTDVEKRLSRGGVSTSPTQLPFTREAKKILETAMTEASKADHTVIGTGHVLLALVLVPDTVPFAVLEAVGAEGADVRAKLVASGGWDGATRPIPQTDSRARVLRSAAAILRTAGHEQLALDVERVASGQELRETS